MRNCLLIAFAVLFIGAQSRAINNDDTEPETCEFTATITGTLFNASCFYIEKNDRKTYEGARSWCNSNEGVLFVPQSIEENTFIMSQIAKMAFTWHGITQKKEQPKWEQTSKVDLTQLNWDDPSIVQTNWSISAPEKCAVSENVNGRRNLYWTSCEEEHFFVCEAKNKIEVFNKDPECDEPETTTIEPEASGEESTDCDEEIVTTPTTAPDCDETEGTTEVQTTTTTTTTTTAAPKIETWKCADGWMQFEKRCYFIERTEKASFEDAKTECESNGATLFTPETRDEYKTLLANTVVYAHTWINVSPYDYSNIQFSKTQMDWLVKTSFALDEANGYTYFRSNCLAYYNGNIDSAKYVYYYPCDWKFLYICEKKAVVEYS